MSRMTIAIDTREQRPYTFEIVRNPVVEFDTERKTLSTGDYATGRAVIERKSLADLYGTVTHGRERFIRELQRMSEFEFAAIVIEAEWSAILKPNDHLQKPTQATPKSVMASLLAWTQRFGVHVFTCPGRDVAEIFTFRLLERWHRDHDKN